MARVRVALAIAAACACGVLMAGCGGSGSTTPPPPTDYTLTIDSANPSSGVQIGVTENGSLVSAGVTTPGAVTAASGTTFILTAPSTAGNNTFASWTGCTSSSGATCNVTLNANTTVTANYTTPTTYTLTVDSSGPSGISIADSPADNNGTTSGSTPFTLTYNSGTMVTLTAPLTPGWVFTSWSGCTSTSGSAGSVCSVTLNANTTVTATYTLPATSVLTIDSVNPASGVMITATPQGSTSVTETTPATITAQTGTIYSLTAPATAPNGNTFGSWTGCTTASAETCNVTLSANATVTASYTTPPTLVTPTVTVAPASSSINPLQALEVTIAVAGPSSDPAPSGSVTLSNGTTYTSAATSLTDGSTNITVPPGSLALGVNTLTATYTPDTEGAMYYTSATGDHVVTEATITPTVTVTPTSSSIDANQSDTVTVTVAGGTGDPTPTGSVTLTGDGYDGTSTALTGGSAQFTIPAGTLSSGNDTLSSTYTPDSTSSGIYGAATGTSGTIVVTAVTVVTVNQSSPGPAVTDQILGVNLEAWYDVDANASTVAPPMQTAGIQALRWPGGSWSDAYHWTGANQYISGDASTQPYMCDTGSDNDTENEFSWAGNADDAFSDFETDIATAGPFDLALTANYGSNEACNGGGDPNEAAAWAAAAVADGHPASHITIGNEVYGSWEYDLHSSPHNATTYADAVTGSSGYYDLIKNAVTNAGGNASNTLVGVVVDANCTTSSGCTDGWDSTVLSTAKGYYDFVEYHYYPQYQGEDASDSDLIGTGASSYVQNFTTNINTIKQELTTAGEPNTPIYVGEISSNSGNGGTQNWSITQALYAGQILGEAMNDGVSRLTWWDGFGNCEGVGSTADGDLLPPNNSTLYGWQDWGAQNIFSAGPSTDTDCPGDGAAGTPSPTAMAFQLFSNVAVNGENVLTNTVSGDTTDVRAYSATHSGGTALVLFNLNATTAEPVQITLSTETSTTGMTVITYDKEIYDYTNVNCQADSVSTFTPYPCTYDSTHDYGTAVWAAPTTTSLGAQSLPYTLVLQPWSMNVVVIQ